MSDQKPAKFSEIPPWIFDEIEKRLENVSYHDYGHVVPGEGTKFSFHSLYVSEPNDCGQVHERRMHVVLWYVEYFGAKSITCINHKDEDPAAKKSKPSPFDFRIPEGAAVKFVENPITTKAWVKQANENLTKQAYEEIVKACDEVLFDVMDDMSFDSYKNGKKKPKTKPKTKSIGSMLFDGQYLGQFTPSFNNLEIP